MKKIFLIGLLSLACMSSLHAAIVLTRNDGTSIQHNVEVIGKWVYAGGMVQLFAHNGVLLAQEPISNIQKITFGAITAIDHVAENTVSIYPNPTQDKLVVSGIESQTLRVFDMQGRLLQTAVGTEISVVDLSNGTYLLQVGTQVIRFVKQ